MYASVSKLQTFLAVWVKQHVKFLLYLGGVKSGAMRVLFQSSRLVKYIPFYMLVLHSAQAYIQRCEPTNTGLPPATKMTGGFRTVTGDHFLGGARGCLVRLIAASNIWICLIVLHDRNRISTESVPSFSGDAHLTQRTPIPHDLLNVH